MRAGLARHVLGRRVERVEVFDARPLRRQAGGPGAFVRGLEDRVLTAAVRRGKFLWLPLDDGAALVAHLGMSGQLLVRTAAPPGTVTGSPGFSLPSTSAASTASTLAALSGSFGGSVSKYCERHTSTIQGMLALPKSSQPIGCPSSSSNTPSTPNNIPISQHIASRQPLKALPSRASLARRLVTSISSRITIYVPPAPRQFRQRPALVVAAANQQARLRQIVPYRPNTSYR